MAEPIIGFVPCRAGSERVKDKNLREFAGFSHGLLELKLLQLSKVSKLEKIIVSSNDENVLAFASAFAKIDSRVTPLERPNSLGSSGTSMTDLIKYISELEETGVIFWTHVTLPFVNSMHYGKIIDEYSRIIESGYDSLFTATVIHKFLWTKTGPYNYSAAYEKWPRSQDIQPLYDINHAVYMLPFSLMRLESDRVGKRPYLYDLPEEVALDIDWENQFQLLNDIATAKKQRNISLV